jgi:hypothetical protein
VFTLTPVTIADIATRFTGSTVQYTLKVVRAKRDADTDRATPYADHRGQSASAQASQGYRQHDHRRNAHRSGVGTHARLADHERRQRRLHVGRRPRLE